MTQSASDSRHLLLSEILYIPTMTFNLFSLQKIINANYILVFAEIQNKRIIKKSLPDGKQEQIALLDISHGRLTLECHMAPRSPAAIPTTSTQLQLLPALLPTPSTSTIYPTTSVPAPAPGLYLSRLDITLLHRRLGHSGQPAIHRLLS